MSPDGETVFGSSSHQLMAPFIRLQKYSPRICAGDNIRNPFIDKHFDMGFGNIIYPINENKTINSQIIVYFTRAELK